MQAPPARSIPKRGRGLNPCTTPCKPHGPGPQRLAEAQRGARPEAWSSSAPSDFGSSEGLSPSRFGLVIGRALQRSPLSTGQPWSVEEPRRSGLASGGAGCCPGEGGASHPPPLLLVSSGEACGGTPEVRKVLVQIRTPLRESSASSISIYIPHRSDRPPTCPASSCQTYHQMKLLDCRPQAPKGIRLRDFEQLVKDSCQPCRFALFACAVFPVEEHQDWLEGPTARGKGRKNMYDLCPEVIIARVPAFARLWHRNFCV